MNLLAWLRDPGFRGQAIYKLYDEDPQNTAQALAELRERGALTDGSLRGGDLRESQLTNADLSHADLEEVNFKEADLAGVNLEGANLAWGDLSQTILTNANLRDSDLFEASFYDTDLTGADLTGADLRYAIFDAAILTGATITPAQLAKAAMLYGTTMPDGTDYDGRYQLERDIALAVDEACDPEVAAEMAEFYGVSIEAYESGQAWASENLAALRETADPLRDTPLHETEVIENEDETVEEESEILYDPGSLADHVDLIVASFEAPNTLADYRRLGWNRDDLKDMGVWIASLLLWLPTILMVAVLIVVNFRPLLNQITSAPDGILTVATIILLDVALPIFGFMLTRWSASQRRGTLTTHFAQGLAFLIMLRATNSIFISLARLIGFVLGYVTLARTGTDRSRRLLTGLTMVGITQAMPLQLLWQYVLSDAAKFNIVSILRLDPSAPSFIVIFTWTFLFLGIIQAVLIVSLIRMALRTWVIPQQHSRPLGILAWILVILYGLLSFGMGVLNIFQKYVPSLF